MVRAAVLQDGVPLGVDVPAGLAADSALHELREPVGRPRVRQAIHQVRRALVVGAV